MLLLEANPKVISRRTSYLRSRLAFHSYPQLIRQFFNTERFGPPWAVKPTSPWPWIDPPVSGLRHVTQVARFALAFASAPCQRHLTLQHNVTRRIIIQKAHRHTCPYGYSAPIACRHTVSGSIPPLPGIFPTFPYGTGSLSVTKEYSALEGGSPEFPPGFSYLTVLGKYPGDRNLSLTGLSPPTVRLSSLFS